MKKRKKNKMNEAQNIKLGLSSGESVSKKSFKRVTLKNIFDAIDKRTIPESLKNKLKEKAKNYPHQALNMFLVSLDRFIAEDNKKYFNVNKNELEFPK